MSKKGQHRIISPYGEVRIVGAERPKPRRSSGNRQRNNRRAKAPEDPQEQVGILLRRLSFQMAPWRAEWNWAKIRRLEERIDRLVEESERPRARSR